jgi:HSP20 family molecular chaperone IbpA
MAEVTVTTEPAKREAHAPARFDDFFAPVFPVTRFFGRWPFELWRSMAEEMDRAFGFVPKANEDFWTPVVDVRKCEGNLVVTAELPGIRKEEVKLELADNALLIKGERRTEHKEDHKGYHLRSAATESSTARFLYPKERGRKRPRLNWATVF